MSDLQTRYSISIMEKQEIKHRRFFIRGRYTIDRIQDMHVYKHKEELNCYVVYKTNRMKAINANNWDDCDIVRSIGEFDENKYDYIFGERKVKRNSTTNFSENRVFENVTSASDFDLLGPLRYMNIYSLQDMWDNIEYICPLELSIQFYCQCQVNLLTSSVK